MPFILFNQKLIARGNEDPSWCDEIVHIGRPSILENPYPIGAGPNNTREAVIKAYERHLAHEFRHNAGGLVMTELKRLGRLHSEGKSIGLICHCTPLPCHGSVTIRAAIAAHIINI